MSGRDVTADGPAEVAQALTSRGKVLRGVAGFSHAALLYDGTAALSQAVSAIGRAAAAGAPLHVLVTPATLDLIGSAIGPAAPGIEVADMADIGRNPARIIAAAQSFADEHPGRHVDCLWEPAWPARTPAELLEVARHEALSNLAFAGQDMTIVCLYDTARLPAAVLADAERTHPVVVSAGSGQVSPAYLGPGRFPPGCDDPLPPPAAGAADLAFGGHLGLVREFAASQARSAGLNPARAGDLVLAVSEVAANAVGHAAGDGTLRCWCTDSEIICQVEDRGHIADPLAGCRRQPPDAQGGHGLWLVNRVCDLVERRTGQSGTVTRLHMRREPALVRQPSR